MPLSFATICTLIGTSTNLVVHGLLQVLLSIVLLIATPLVWSM
jgi:hypothetical protein